MNIPSATVFPLSLCLALLATGCPAEDAGDCEPGFAASADGQCVDVDECATDTHDCDPNASCSNTPGGFDCACDDGFEGNGRSCADIDECAARTDTCDDNAICSNAPGGFFCDCDEGFAGDGFSCRGTARYGEFCDDPVVCASGLCLNAPFEHCTVFCDQTVANACGKISGAAGLCIDAGSDTVCAGSLEFGLDDDDELMSPGDSVSRNLDAVDDADVFQFTLAIGSYRFTATPDQPDDDIQVEFYGNLAQNLGTLNNAGDGGAEVATFNQEGGTGVVFVVVRNIGDSTGGYTFTSAEE